MADEGRTSRVEQLQEQVNQRVRQAVEELQRELRQRLRKAGDEIVGELENRLGDDSPELPESFLSSDELSPLAEEAAAAARAEAEHASASRLVSALAALDRAGKQAEVLDALVQESASFAGRTAVFLARGDGLELWGSSGWDEAMEGARVPFADEGPWSAAALGSGATELETSYCGELCSRVEAPLPAAAALVPLFLRDKLAAVVYADHRDGEAMTLEAIQSLTYVAALALESLPFRNRESTATLRRADGSGVAGAPPVFAARDEEEAGEGAEVAGDDDFADDSFAGDDTAGEDLGDEPAAVGFDSGLDDGGADDGGADDGGSDWGADDAGDDAAHLDETAAMDADEALGDEGPADDEPAMGSDFSYELEDAPEADDDLGSGDDLGGDDLAEGGDDWGSGSDLDATDTFTVDEAGVDTADDESADDAEEEDWASRPESEGFADTADDSAEDDSADDSGDYDGLPDVETEAADEDDDLGGDFGDGGAPDEVSPDEVAPFDDGGDDSSDEGGAQMASASPAATVYAPAPPPPASATPEPMVAPGEEEDEAREAPEAPEAEEPEAAAPETAAAPASAVPASPPAPPPAPPAADGGSEVAPPADLQGPGRAFTQEEPETEDDARHDEARRLARLLVSEIRLYNEDEVDEGRRNHDIYQRLKEDIDRSRQMYEERVDAGVRDTSDYFYDELVRNLAGGDEGALGL